MAEYRLYCFAQSGNAYKAALMLNLCGADWEPRFVDFFKGETRTPEYIAQYAFHLERIVSKRQLETRRAP